MLKIQDSDNVVRIGKDFYRVKNILIDPDPQDDRNSNIILVVQKFSRARDHFFEPSCRINSSKLGIFCVSSLVCVSQDIMTFPISVVKYKMALLPLEEQGDFVAIPMLHTVHSSLI